MRSFLFCFCGAGPTVIVDQRFDAAAGVAVPETPPCSALVYPRANHFCV